MQVSERIQGVIIGLLLGFEDGLPLVVFAGNPEDRAVPARSLAHLGPDDVGSEVALLYEDGDSARPLIVVKIVEPRLREEAEREKRRRSSEGAGLETQPELGLSGSADDEATRRARATRTRTER